MMPLTAAFAISNRTVWEQAHACIQNLPVRLAVEQGAGQSDPAETDALLDRIERHRVDVVLVEASRIALPLEEFVRRIRSAAAQPAVFVLNAEVSPELILEALRAGANEYLYPPLADTLRDALQKLSGARSKGGSDTSGALGKIFGFLSARGGCGATTFAVHVATDIARQTGARQIREPVLLADCDFDAGLLRFLMKSKSAYSVRDALDNLRRMDSSLWKALVSSPADNLDVITAPDELAAKRHPGREEMTHLMRFIRSTYPLSIVDFGRGISPAALDALPELETLYLIATPDVMCLESAGRAIQMVEERGFAGNRIDVLLNKVKARETPDREGIGKHLGRPCAAVFRNDHMSLYDAYSEGRFLPASSGLGKELHALADAIRVQAAGRAQAAGERSRDKNEKTSGTVPAGGKRWFSFIQKAPAIEKTREQGAQA
jgi:pilus assembly protein CpaE